MDSVVTTLEERLAKLEAVSAAGSSSSSTSNTEQVLKEYQLYMLEKLKAIKAELLSSSNSSISNKDMIELQLENAKLKKENEKQAYRVKILVRSLEEAEKA